MSGNTYNIESVAEILQGKFLQFHVNVEITELITDSRQNLNQAFLFFAIISARNDGHKYIADAYKKGVRNFVVSQAVNLDQIPEANVIQVADSLKSLQLLAKYHRCKYQLPIIGVTGSNGKTIVKEWLFQLLQNKMKIVRSPKSYNSQIGVPLSVWKISEEDELGIFEAGISQKDEMSKLQKMINPTIGVITNIGDAHLENFSSKQEIAQEKMELFADCKTLVFCKDDPIILEQVKKLKLQRSIAWSYQESNSDYWVKNVEKKPGSTEIQIKLKEESYSYSIPFADDASIENSISCFFTLFAIGELNEDTLKSMEDLQAVAMRLEIKEGMHSSLLINDSYNSDLQSLKIALQVLWQHGRHKRRILILSDLIQVSQSKEQLYQEIARLIEERRIDLFVGIGKDIMAHQKYFPQNSFFYDNVKQFLREFDIENISASAVLIKGARKFGLEKISESLQQKSHETILEINLNSVIDNLNYIRSLLHKRTKVMAMVKAFSYGSGSSEIAKALQFHQVDYLGVAYTDEGMDLRKSGISTPIMVMNPEIESYENMIRHQLEPEIFSFRVLHKFMDALQENQYFASSDEPFPIHIKLDTGMHRLGFAEEDIPQLAEELTKYPTIKIVSVFSHLTSSEDESQDEYSMMQVEKFEKMANRLTKALGYKPLFHILNSNGILRFPQFQFDMVRLGIGLYGVVGNEESQKHMKYVSRLKTHISQIMKLKAGERVGYSRMGIKEKAGKIATIPVGYADGIGRSLGNGNWQVQIGNCLFPTIGNICMDMCMIDLLDAEVEEGDEVLVFGGKKTIKDLAVSMEKSPYEVLTGISGRVKRIYFFE